MTKKGLKPRRGDTPPMRKQTTDETIESRPEWDCDDILWAIRDRV